MLTLNDGRSELWQWDTGRTLAVDADCSQVHFSNKVFGRSIDVDVVDGEAIIPDILLQIDKELNVWAFVGTAENGYTKISKTFKVNRRNKPADYVFTPPDQTTLAELVGRLDKIEESQDPDAIKNAVEDYLQQNPVEAPVQSVNGQTGEVELTAEDVGAISQDDLQGATNEVLAQAKASGEFDGADGHDGAPGQDGITPTIGDNGNWYLGETDTGKPSRGETGPAGADGRDGADGQPGENGTDGYSPTANVTQTDNGATITITDKNGTTTATVTNGKDGADGNPGADGSPGKDGADGGYYTPAVTQTTDNTMQVSFTPSKATMPAVEGKEITLPAGPQGQQGTKGPAGADGVGIQSVEQTTTSTEDGGTNVVTVIKTDGTSSTFAVRNGRRGSVGPAGADGNPGADGSPGKDGSNGADGKSAYQYAVDGGYTGTEAEFAALMSSPGAYPVVDMTADTAELLPNIYYRWGKMSALTITLGAETAGITNEYCFEFVSGETATTLTVPDTVKWVQEPTIEADKTYQVSILNGIGVIDGV